MTKHYAHQVDSNFNVLKLIKKFDANNDAVLSADELPFYGWGFAHKLLQLHTTISHNFSRVNVAIHLI
jgi:hypothetical protein